MLLWPSSPHRTSVINFLKTHLTDGDCEREMIQWNTFLFNNLPSPVIKGNSKMQQFGPRQILPLHSVVKHKKPCNHLSLMIIRHVNVLCAALLWSTVGYRCQFISCHPLQAQCIHFHVSRRLFAVMGPPTTGKNTTLLSNDRCLTEARAQTPEICLQVSLQ